MTRLFAVVLLLLSAAPRAAASAYDGQPKLIVILILDQVRHDYLERNRDQFASDGFRLFLERGAVFTNCAYDYANVRTAPGHASISTGAYTDWHGIMGNDWYSPEHRRNVSSVEDDKEQLVGLPESLTGASPRKLRAGTFADELKLATDGRSRIFTLSFKDRSAILMAGFSGTAFWLHRPSGTWVSSTYYMKELPAWATAFNSSGRADRYWNQEWTDAKGNVLRKTTKPAEKANYYDIVGKTAFGNAFHFDFARELLAQEKLGTGPATDLLVISLSPPDILGHEVGPNSPELAAMILDLDRQWAAFMRHLGEQIGTANIWFALTADHGSSPLPAFANKLRVPVTPFTNAATKQALNLAVRAALPRAKPDAEYVAAVIWPFVYLSEELFTAAGLNEQQAEDLVATEVKRLPAALDALTKLQLKNGPLPQNEHGRRYANSYSPYGGWYVRADPRPWHFTATRGADHFSLFNYDAQVPVAFLGLPFQPGYYRNRCEPTDIVVTLSSLLGIPMPTSATGRVLTEALRETRVRSEAAR